MKTNWRPDGWEETLREILDHFNVTYMNSEECKLIEAGANAMLEALKKDALYSNDDEKMVCKPHISAVDMINATNSKKGCLVFIPDEVKE